MTPRLSLIVPTGDRAVLLRRCLAQAAWQTTTEPFEVVIVDGGRRESAARILDHLPKLREMTNARSYRVLPTTSVGERRNIAVEHAHADLIAHFDDDDFYHRDYVDQLLQWWDTHQPVDLGGFCQFWHYDFSRRRGWRTNLWDSGHPYGATFLYRKSTWKKVGGFQPLQKGEDQEFFSAVHKSGDRIAAAARSDLYVYMRHSSNVTGAILPVFHPDWTDAARAVLGGSLEFYDDLAELANLPGADTEGVQFHLPQNLRTFPGRGTP